MNIGHFSFSSFGGAGKVASVLHDHQINLGLNSKFFNLTSENLSKRPFKNPLLTTLATLDRFIIGKKSNTSMFSLLRSQYQSSKITSQIKNLDVVHLHWIPGILKISEIGFDSKSSIKLIWSIQDMWPFTGGCHFAGRCNNYTVGCDSCPQVNLGFKTLVHKEFQKKYLSLLDLDKRITLVYPSEYIANKGRQSKILSNLNSVVIGNPIKISTNSKATVVKSSPNNSLNGGRFVIGLVAGDLSEKRKNVMVLVKWWKDNYRYLHSNFSILLVGNNGNFAKGMDGITIVSDAKDSEMINELYLKMNLHLSFSTEETFGYTIIESGLMGVPSLCFSNTAQSELIVDNKTGYVIDRIEDLLPLLNLLVLRKIDVQKVGAAAKRMFVSNFSQKVVGQKYLELYEQKN
jgi:glycosyltransferase involved in cell wall biosynthesis